ncbi:MAG: hypothetical protein ACTHNS_05610 [Marmoricola sp.]
MIRRERRLPTLPVLGPALALVAVVALAGCGGSSTPGAGASPSGSSASGSSSTAAAPTPSVPVPSGVTLTDPGTELGFGATATVPYRPNDKRASVLALTVEGVARARLKDFSAYVLDKRTQASTPYYVRVQVRNVGAGQVGGTDVPLWAVDQKNVLIHSSSFTNSFQRCPSPTLPRDFGPGATLDTCLVYLVPDKGTLTSVSFRPLQAFDPITWHGTVTGPGKGGHHRSHGKKKS